MSELSIFHWLIGVGLICGGISAATASAKHRSVEGWFVLGFLFGPIGVLVSAAMSRENRIEKLISCPRCAEKIQPEADLCRFCGSSVIPRPSEPVKKTLGAATSIVAAAIVFVSILMMVTSYLGLPLL